MLALLNARLLDGTGGSPRDGVTLLVDGGRIVGLGQGEAPPGAEVVDVAGATVMPGLIDVHVHISPPSPVTEAERLALVEVASTFLARGFTTVRDLGSYGSTLFDLRSAIARGELAGPRLVLSGQVISAVCPGAESFAGMSRECAGAEEWRLAVREQVAAGADGVKVMVTGALTVPGEDINPSQVSVGELSAVVDEARLLGVPVAAHAEGADGVRVAVAAGVDSIEHGEMAHTIPDALEQMAERGIVLVPTLCVFDAVESAFGERFPPWVRERAKRLGEAARLTVSAARAAGVTIAAGADAPPHGLNARELILLVDAGLSAREAIMAATSVAAEVCRIADEVGTLAVGKHADLIVVEGDPLEDIAVLSDPRRLRHVLKGGDLVHPAGGTA